MVNEFILGMLLSINISSQELSIRLYFVSFLIAMIHDQLKNISAMKLFTFQTYIIYMIMYYNKNCIDSTDLNKVVSHPTNEGLLGFSNRVMSKIFYLLLGYPPLRIFYECKTILQFSPNTYVGTVFVMRTKWILDYMGLNCLFNIFPLF